MKKERMTGNVIGDEGAKAMSEVLYVNPPLTTLYLGGEEGRKEKEKRRKSE